MLRSEKLPIKKRVYSLAMLDEIGEHPSGIRFSELKRSLRISKPCLAYTLIDLQKKGFIRQTDSGLYVLKPKGKKHLANVGENIETKTKSLIRLLIRRTEDRLKTPIRDEALIAELEKFFYERIIELIKEGVDEASAFLASPEPKGSSNREK